MKFSTGLTEISSRKVFHDGCAKRDIFPQQILNKNRLCLAHCALNRSFTVGHIRTGSFMGRGNQYIELVKVLYCKLPTNGKQLPAFSFEGRTRN